ncbi:flagellar hook protein FlgE [Helicobacter sp. WB40]|uniref:flagellar hook protein FlgE n=1 Tax=Helicobacter sp. WB40 TaxID=3004130 RepID=UPI0022EBFC59|nr:flagellar hook protein FlgE [Helicobacter sp. WB40]MDA3967402.1 flagellar hook protein FlgE [Helicobacter sp. WB40]
MLRSLWAGVSGMQGHQIALDIESNNIANVNTNGFKYSRAEFATMISQTKRSATSPYGGYGGVNDLSVGLGTGIETTTKIFSQGSLQNTDRRSDLALSGQGMFVLSNNGGYSNVYTRDGAFGFDAKGNFVNSSGFIVQGWVRDLSQLDNNCGIADRDVVDTSRPAGNITIDPRLTIPAKATTQVVGNINLTNGNKTQYTTCPSPLDSTAANNYIAGGLDRLYDSKDVQHEVAQDLGVMFNENGDAMRLQAGQGIWVSYQTAETEPLHIASGAVGASSITINGQEITWQNDSATSGSSSLLAAQVAINQLKDKTGVEAVIRQNAQGKDTLVLINPNQLDGDASKKNIRVTGMSGAVQGFETDSAGANGLTQTTRVTTAYLYKYTNQTDADSNSKLFRTTEDLRALIMQDANIVKNFGGDSGAATNAIRGGQFQDSNWSVNVTMNANGQFQITNKHDGIKASDSTAAGIPGINRADAPQFDNLNIFVSAFNDALTTTNVLFKNAMKGMNTGVLAEGGSSTTTGGFRLANYAQSVKIYDSLGNPHEFTMEFKKIGGNEWSFRLIVPEPAEIVGAPVQRPNIFEGGSVTFGPNGELLGFNPSTIEFKPNNGASFPQSIDLAFGKGGGFDGLTSTGLDSSATNVNGDGYPSGQLKDYSFNSAGVLVGHFNNGVNLALAQVAVATFANYEGLQEAGSNIYTESANSGRATIGTPGSGGRADVEASKLEMSNSDLSRGLTQLIVVQRGFQASSKSITTSDQILNTLLGLKQ